MDPDPEGVFRVEGGSLSATTCDDVLAKLAAFEAKRQPHAMVLDMSRLTAIDPYGMAVICLMAKHLSRAFWDITCRMPDSADLRSYLQRMGVLSALAQFVSLDPETPPPSPAPKNEGLLELTAITRREDVSNVLRRIGERVGALLAEELNYRDREISGFKNVVAELCHNILDHSFDRGYVAAQRYADERRGGKYAVIGVGDLGIGIRESLAARYDVSDWTHATAITNALRKQFSREPTRGLGLYVVQRICHDYGGGMHIRSGDARVTVRGRSLFRSETAPFPGTQISIMLHQAGSAR